MPIRHLALAVRDPAASATFYLTVVGLDGVAREEPWGVRLDLEDGFMVALIRSEVSPSAGRDAVHFGCVLSGPDEARRMRERLRDAGAREIEWEDSGGYVGLKVADPDDYVVELYFESN